MATTLTAFMAFTLQKEPGGGVAVIVYKPGVFHVMAVGLPDTGAMVGTPGPVTDHDADPLPI